jgi:secreted PhoX family phosphatase
MEETFPVTPRLFQGFYVPVAAIWRAALEVLQRCEGQQTGRRSGAGAVDAMDRRAFLTRSAALVGGMAIAGPLQAFASRVARGQTVISNGYGPLVDKGDLFLPEAFNYTVISTSGDPMTTIDPGTGQPYLTPTRFDGMAAYPGSHGTTILVRNHENRSRRQSVPAAVNEIGVIVPEPYDSHPNYKGGVTKLVTGPDHTVPPIESAPLIGGTVFNCAGAQTPWGTWITCEELFNFGNDPHGYIFEVNPYAGSAHAALPITAAGRFEHEAGAVYDEFLFLTEDDPVACFYRYSPEPRPAAFGDLANSTGPLEALVVTGHPEVNTSTGWPAPVGEWLDVRWVQVDNPNPAMNTSPIGVRFQARTAGAAVFSRTEGCWLGDDRVYFDCTNAGAAGEGQIWELDPKANQLRLLFESPNSEVLSKPDNLVVLPVDEPELFLCEDHGAEAASGLPYIRGLTADGSIYDFARAKTNVTEFCGACFSQVSSPEGRNVNEATLFVNQQGDPPTGKPGVTYAIRGPWKRD